MIAWAGIERLRAGLDADDAHATSCRARAGRSTASRRRWSARAAAGPRHERRLRIAVLGGGAWGTALALAMLRAGNAVTPLGPRRRDRRRDSRTADNPRYLPGIAFETGIAATHDSAEALAGADCVLVAMPAQALRAVLRRRRGPIWRPDAPLVLCAKGIERDTGSSLSGDRRRGLPAQSVAVLSGPSFAADVARGLPTAVMVAASDEALAAELAARFCRADCSAAIPPTT